MHAAPYFAGGYLAQTPVRMQVWEEYTTREFDRRGVSASALTITDDGVTSAVTGVQRDAYTCSVRALGTIEEIVRSLRTVLPCVQLTDERVHELRWEYAMMVLRYSYVQHRFEQAAGVQDLRAGGASSVVHEL